VQPFSKGKRGRWRGSFTASEVDDTVKSNMAAGEAKGGDWRLEVEDDQRKLGRWAKPLTSPAKKIWLCVWFRKVGEEIPAGQNGK
jgi:hypothetical protein